MKTEKDQKKSEPAEKNQDYVRASYALKRKIVDLVSNGRISKNAAAKKYNVSRSSLDYWMKKFSTLEEKETTMSKDKELKKLRQRIEELEFIKDFQQDLIVEYEIETGDLKSKKYLPEQLAKEIEQKKKKGSVKLLCEMFGISRQAYHKRLNKIEKLEVQRAVILDLIKPIRKKMHRVGTIKIYNKIKNDMRKKNIKMGRDKLFDFLRFEKMLVAKKKNYTKTTNSFHYFYKYKNIVKDIEVTAPEQVWVSDITYIDTDAGNGFLSLITDYYSKKIVGFHLADNLKTEGTLKALEMAIKSRKYPNSPLIHHSDRGIQYCSYAYIQKLTENNIKPSMTENSDPYENAIAERVNGILKDEFDIAQGFIHHIQAVKEISYAISTYNTFRPHLSCEMMTPEQAHLKGTYKLKKWGGRKKYNKAKSAETETLF